MRTQVQHVILLHMRVEDSLLISDLRSSYLAGRFTPADIMARVMDRADGAEERHIWIRRLSRDQVMGYVQALQSRSIDDLPLYGIPFVIKDNIDLAGVPTRWRVRSLRIRPLDRRPSSNDCSTPGRFLWAKPISINSPLAWSARGRRTGHAAIVSTAGTFPAAHCSSA